MIHDTLFYLVVAAEGMSYMVFRLRCSRLDHDFDAVLELAVLARPRAAAHARALSLQPRVTPRGARRLVRLRLRLRLRAARHGGEHPVDRIELTRDQHRERHAGARDQLLELPEPLPSHFRPVYVQHHRPDLEPLRPPRRRTLLQLVNQNHLVHLV